MTNKERGFYRILEKAAQGARSGMWHMKTVVFWFSEQRRRLWRRVEYWPWRRILVGSFLMLLLLLAWISKDLPTAETFSSRAIAQSTRIYDRTGTILLYDLHGNEKRTLVSLGAISPFLANATIAAEDDRFYHHIGVDFAGIVRSVFRNIQSGQRAQGGSTITQQLVRNAVLSPKKTYARKIREVVLALEVEARFSKDEILEAYLNQIPYGSLIYGVEAASETYFGKPAKELTLAEAATLAAIPKAPSRLSPYGSHQDELLVRRNYILDRMALLGYISPEEAKRAQEETPTLLPPHNAITAPHFIFFVQEALEQRFGKDRVEQGGLKVITTLDADLQQTAEKAVSTGAAKNEKRFRGRNAALVSLNPKTGEVLAMVGSRDYFDPAYDGNVNVATRQRQPGSSFKPIVYATAFKRGFTPDTILFDLPTEFGTSSTSYKPDNYTGQVYGPVTARQALSNSLNISSVKMLWLAGIPETIETARDLGITTLTDPDRYGLSLVLGGGAVTLLEETGAFGVFANDGLRSETESLLRVEDMSGKVLFEHHERPYRALDQEVARQISSILSDTGARSLVFGAIPSLSLGAIPAAVKTGTAQDFRDAWTVGYTPSLVTGVWVGNNDYSPMGKGADGSVVAAPIWNLFMRAALAGKPIDRFMVPKSVTTKKPILDGAWSIEETVDIDRASGNRATANTPLEWIEQRTYRTIHDTLFWVDRTNPRGPRPKNPASDPQFVSWESAVQAWVTSNPELAASVTERPPQNQDDIHTSENVPRVSIRRPSSGDIVSATFTLEVSASAQLGIESVVASLDGVALGTLAHNPSTGYYEKNVTINDDFSQEQRQLTVRAFDRYGNAAATTISITVSGSGSESP